MDKQTLRKRMLEYRLSLKKEYMDAISATIAERFFGIHGGYESYILYSPIKNEVDTLPIARLLWQAGKKVYYPKVSGDKLLLGYCAGTDDLQSGYMGILEPRNVCESIAADLIVLPGIAFDETCYRIGYGKGYYDRFLAASHIKLSVGVAYRGQVMSTVYPCDHDVPVDTVLTESSVYWRN